MNDQNNGEEDYIFRGQSPGPQDGQPYDPPLPPPASPPPVSPHPTTPPPGFPPPSSAGVAGPETPKKKRWPWIVAAVVLLCGLPLGGCVALVAFGVNELNERSDEIEATVVEFFDAVESGESATVGTLADGQSPCSTPDGLIASIDQFGGNVTWSPDRTAFVERTGNTTLSSNADPESLFIQGRPDESVAFVDGRLETDSGVQDVQVLLSKPASLWRICTVSLR